MQSAFQGSGHHQFDVFLPYLLSALMIAQTLTKPYESCGGPGIPLIYMCCRAQDCSADCERALQRKCCRRVASFLPKLPSPGLAQSRCRIEQSLQHDHGTAQLGATCCNLENMCISGRSMDAGTSTGRCLLAYRYLPVVASLVNTCKLHHTVQHAGAPAAISNDEQDHDAALKQKHPIRSCKM